MKKKFSLAMAIIALLIPAINSQARGANPVDQVLTNMQAAGQKIKTFSANINQVKKNLQLPGPAERASGSIVLQRAGEKAIIKLDNGNEVAITGNQIIYYQARILQAIHTTRNKQATDNPGYNFISTPFTSSAQLKANFTINYLGDEGSTAMLELIPKNPNLQKAMLWVDKGSWLPVKFKVIAKDSEATFTLSNLQTNIGVSGDTFKINYAPGTKHVQK
jgi:outer membrane lipoprotein-sorting protein